ncbi:GTPase-activating protein gyp1-like isoform X2 [Solanum tuberosum]|uniref:GTPase-activating protein gyp1-like isoform X2 n=1 Tax=Solanum tuberosum TaxID=4113 RepID=UPI0003D29A0D|nr:PREDICTED: GTPase-activating protein gyp1-like isoform X2 [Solanum tuberosum]
MIFQISSEQMKRSTCFGRLLLIALEQCLMFLFSNKHKFRNPWSTYFTYELRKYEQSSTHMEEQGLEFLQFAFRWFNCLLILEIPFHLVTRLWDTYLAVGDALPDFLVYIAASFLLTISC